MTSLEELDLHRNFGIISKQPNLKNLYIKSGDFASLECNENIQVVDFGLSNGIVSEASIKSLENFVKTQRKIERFHIEMYMTEVHRFSSIVSYILSLDSLRCVSTKYAVLFNAIPEIRTEHSKQLKLRAISHVSEFRPATTLKVFSKDVYHQMYFLHPPLDDFAMSLNSGNFGYFVMINGRLLLGILKEVEIEIKIEANSQEMVGEKDLDEFTKNHRKINALKWNVEPCKSIELKTFKRACKNLKELRKFLIKMTYEKFDSSKIYKIIKKYAPNLECLVVNFGGQVESCIAKNQKIEAYFKKKMPTLKFKIIFGYQVTLNYDRSIHTTTKLVADLRCGQMGVKLENLTSADEEDAWL